MSGYPLYEKRDSFTAWAFTRGESCGVLAISLKLVSVGLGAKFWRQSKTLRGIGVSFQTIRALDSTKQDSAKILAK